MKARLTEDQQLRGKCQFVGGAVSRSSEVQLQTRRLHSGFDATIAMAAGLLPKISHTRVVFLKQYEL
jgi:hypothetical protein